MSTRTLDSETIARVQALRREGLSYRAIAQATGIGFGRARYYCLFFDPAKVRTASDKKARRKARIEARYGMSPWQWDRRRRWAKDEARKTGEPVEAIYERWGIAA